MTDKTAISYLILFILSIFIITNAEVPILCYKALLVLLFFALMIVCVRCDLEMEENKYLQEKNKTNKL